MNTKDNSLNALHDVSRATLEASNPNGYGEANILASDNVYIHVAGIGEDERTTTNVSVVANDQVGANYYLREETEKFGDNPPHSHSKNTNVEVERPGYGSVELKNPRAKEIVRMRAARAVGKTLVEDAQKRLDRASSVVNEHGLLDKPN